MQITAYGTSKRQNSTLVPTGGNSVSVTLKTPTNIIRPIIETTNTNAPTWSMVGMFGRYYFVTNVTYVSNGVYVVNLEVDVLASYKSQILSTPAMVVYASSNYDTLLPDNRIQQRASTNVSTANTDVPYYSQSPVYYLQVVGGTSNSAGGFSTLYKMTASELADLRDILFTDTEIKTEVEKFFTNMFDCIIACYESHIDATVGTSDTVVLGDYDTGVSAVRITQPQLTWTADISIPWPSADWRRTDCSLRLYLPFVGIVQLSPTEWLSASTLGVTATYDFNSGNVFYRLDVATGSETTADVVSYTGNFYAQVPVSRYGVNVGAALTSVMSNPVGVLSVGLGRTLLQNASSNPPAPLDMSGLVSSNAGLQAAIDESKTTVGATEAPLDAVINALSQSLPSTPGIIGGFGNAANAVTPSYVLAVVRSPRNMEVTEYAPLCGAPVYKVYSSLSGFSGFLQCSGFSVAGSMTATERARINAMLNAGIYIE